jgi:DNA-binding transcriptional MocR family regulator
MSRMIRSDLVADPSFDAMTFLNEVVGRFPASISFAPGRPAEEAFDVAAGLEGISLYAEHRARERGCSPEQILRTLGQYGRTNGEIGDLIAAQLARDENIHVPPEAIAVTAGCQEAMMILAMTLFERDRDVLLVSDPAYVGIHGAARLAGIEVVPVATGDAGLTASAMEEAIERTRRDGKRPRAWYDVPDFNNPSGTSVPLDERRRLLALAGREQMWIIEDNPYGMFAYDAPPLPTFKSLDTDRRVIYLGTFAKTLFPGLRVGYLIADQRGPDGQLLGAALGAAKSFVTVNTSPLMQAAAGGMLLQAGLTLRPLVANALPLYRKRRDAMVDALERAVTDHGLGGRVRWNRPAGGFFMTVDLPFEFDRACLTECAAAGVLVCPMSLFARLPGQERRIRLSFSYANESSIAEGVSRLIGFVAGRAV